MSEMNDPRRFEDLSAAYALGALSDEERRAFESYLADRPDLQAEAEELGALADLLALAPEVHEPSPELRSDILRNVGAAPDEHPPVRGAFENRQARRGWLTRMGWMAAAAAALVAVVGLSVWSLSLQNANEELRGEVAQQQEEAKDLRDEVAQQQEEAEDLRANARQSYQLQSSGVAQNADGEVLLSEQGQAVLVAEGLPPAPEGETYAAWVLRDGVPTSAGLFQQENGTTATAVRAPLQGADIIAVTLEPAGGSPAPTSDPILTAKVT